MKRKRKLYWVQTQCHYVYFGWLAFFATYFDLHIFDNKSLSIPYGVHEKIHVLKSVGFMHMFYNIVRPPLKKGQRNSLKIVGDVFSNSMCLYYLFFKNTLFYSEFHLGNNTSKKKTLVFRLLGFLFRNKKFIFMTKAAYNTFASVSKKRLYMPYIYVGDIHKNKTLESSTVKILFIGKLGDKRKNVAFMLDALTQFKDKDIEIGLVGKMNSINPDFPPSSLYYDFTEDFNYYKAIFGSKLHYHGFVDHTKINEIYTQYNLFILPSKFETVGAVVLEAMAHSLPVLLSHTVGAADYVEDGVHGFIFEQGNKKDFIEKIKLFLEQPTLLKKMGEYAYTNIKEHHWHKNRQLMEKLYTQFTLFSQN